MRVGARVLAVWTVFAVSAVRAGTEISVNVSELGQLGTGVSQDGWRVSNVSVYASDLALRFNKKASYVLSPVFSSPVTNISMVVRSSSALGRRLAFSPVGGGTNLIRRVEYAKSYAEQTVSWREADDVRQFRIAFDDGGKTTAWAIRELTLALSGESGGTGGDDPADGTPFLKVSSFLRGDKFHYALDLAAVQESFGDATSVPLAGIDALAGWQAFCDIDPVDEISRNAGTTTTGGFYCWCPQGAPLGLGTYSSAKHTWCFGCIFTNDTAWTVRKMTLLARAGQWGAHNRLEDTLAFEYAVSSALATLVDGLTWTPVGAPWFTTAYTNGQADAELPYFGNVSVVHIPVSLAPGGKLGVRWRDTCPREGSNAALGGERFEVNGKIKFGFFIILD